MSQTSNDFALRCTAYGNPPEIHVIEGVSETPLGPDEVRLAIDCSAFNFTDHLLIQGRYQEKPELPFTPGFDAAGTVTAVGDHVTDFAQGERVVSSGD